MPSEDSNIYSATRLTADALGKPGNRVFYIQFAEHDQVMTFVLEKGQLASLAGGIEQLIAGIADRYPELPTAVAQYTPDEMRILPPVDPAFRVGEISLSYDPEVDLAGLHLKELLFGNSPEEEEMRSVSVMCSRDQLLSFARWSTSVIAQGRQICPQCGEPMDPAGHFCPKKNGHKKA